MRGLRVLPAGVCVVLVVMLFGGWFVWDEPAVEEGRLKAGDGSTRIALDDGRYVELAYGAHGLVERHQTDPGGSWSGPRLIHRSEEYDCKSITLATHKGTLAAVADYGDGCPAGSPPDESIAAVTTADDLDDWDVDVTERFDGWERVRFSSTGDHVEFRGPALEGTATLEWWPVWGFTGTSSTMDRESARGSASWTAGLIDTWGGPGAGWAVALENPIAPLPSEVTLPLSGFALGQGALTPGSVLLWTTLGSIVRAGVLYGIGRLLGRDRLHAVWAKLPLVRARHLERTEECFARHRTKAVLLGHIVPLGRTLVSVPAGVARMPLRVFLVLATLGSLVWNSALILAGYQLGEKWTLAEGYVGVLSVTVLIAVAVTVAWHVIAGLGGRAERHRGS